MLSFIWVSNFTDRTEFYIIIDKRCVLLFAVRRVTHDNAVDFYLASVLPHSLVPFPYP